MYTTDDGMTKVEATFDNDTVWLSIDQMAELFQRDRSVIGKHVRNVFKEGELVKDSVWAKFAYTAADGKDYNSVAKNYLNESELRVLNNLVSGYFDLAEINAIEHKPMYMSDYVQQLDSLLSSSNRQLLQSSGTISHKQAMEKVKIEYRKYQEKTIAPVEQAYLDNIKVLEKEAKKKSRG